MIIPHSILAVLGLIYIPKAFMGFKKTLKTGSIYKQIGTFLLFLAIIIGTIYEITLYIENEYCAGGTLFNGNYRLILVFMLVCIIYTAIFFLSCNRYIELKQMQAAKKEFIGFWLSVASIVILIALWYYCYCM